MKIILFFMTILIVPYEIDASEDVSELYEASIGRIANAWQIRGGTLRGRTFLYENELIEDIHIWGTSSNRIEDEKIATNYLLSMVDDVLRELNSNRALRKYFQTYPLKRKNVHVGIAFNRGEIGDHYPPPAFALIDSCYGSVSIDIFENGKHNEVSRFKIKKLNISNERDDV